MYMAIGDWCNMLACVRACLLPCLLMLLLLLLLLAAAA